jgi:hypothetical protein
MEEVKYKIGYLDEEENWKALVRSKLKDDFCLDLIDIPIALDEIWPYITDNALDALIVDFRLYESGKVSYDGGKVVQEIMKHNTHFPIFIITSYEENALADCENVLIIHGKELFTDGYDSQLNTFKIRLKSVIRIYKAKVEESKKILLELGKKERKNVAITSEDDANRFNAELFLSEIDKDDATPPNLYSIGYSTQLREMLSTAKEIVEKLKQNSDGIS